MIRKMKGALIVWIFGPSRADIFLFNIELLIILPYTETKEAGGSTWIALCGILALMNVGADSKPIYRNRNFVRCVFTGTSLNL
jgi:hypothetical protein